jgi:hypothetical protein
VFRVELRERMRTGRRNRSLVVLAAAAVVGAIGCGSDESGQETTAEPVTIPTVTAPLPTGTAVETAQPEKPKTPEASAPGGTPAACVIPARYQDFKFSGVDCAGALAVADAWDASPNQCNTIDNPDSPLGYNRTCEVEGYTCNAKRDVRSDGRFVSCTQGGASVRFTWFPN